MSDCTRRQFHALVAAGGAALLLPSCGKGASFDGSVTPSGGKAVLGFGDFPALAGVGGSAVVDVQSSFPIVVLRTAEAAAVALSATCTHQFCIMHAQGSSMIRCDCHRAEFSLSGDVLSGPTNIPIPTYAATVGSDAITVDIGS